jgi:hypothetical protein
MEEQELRRKGLLEHVGFELGNEDCCGDRENHRSRRRNYQI